MKQIVPLIEKKARRADNANHILHFHLFKDMPPKEIEINKETNLFQLSKFSSLFAHIGKAADNANNISHVHLPHDKATRDVNQKCCFQC